MSSDAATLNVAKRKDFTVVTNETTTQNLEQQYAERDRLQRKLDKQYPDGFDRDSDMIEAMKRHNLYCGACNHGNGCEHGVPASRY